MVLHLDLPMVFPFRVNAPLGGRVDDRNNWLQFVLRRCTEGGLPAQAARADRMISRRRRLSSATSSASAIVGQRASMDIPRFGLIIVGDEILSGKRTDRHFAKAVELLSARGLRLGWVWYLPDDREQITAALRRSFSSGDVVFVCGGIGATPDDQTRQAAAAALGVEVELHPEAARLITLRTAEMAAEGRGTTDMSTPENRQRLKMGEFPRGAHVIPNPYNRIPGFAIERHFFVPGFPVMAWPMIEAVLDREYARQFHAAPFGERSMLVFETPESAITPLMEEVEARFPGIKSFSLPSVGDGRDGKPARRHIELGVKGAAPLIDEAFGWMCAGVASMGAPHVVERQQAAAARRTNATPIGGEEKKARSCDRA